MSDIVTLISYLYFLHIDNSSKVSIRMSSVLVLIGFTKSQEYPKEINKTITFKVSTNLGMPALEPFFEISDVHLLLSHAT